MPPAAATSLPATPPGFVVFAVLSGIWPPRAASAFLAGVPGPTALAPRVPAPGVRVAATPATPTAAATQPSEGVDEGVCLELSRVPRCRLLSVD
ncbi:hypothetical protein GCM10020360_22920 [Nonlabens tegetincola]